VKWSHALNIRIDERACSASDEVQFWNQNLGADREEIVEGTLIGDNKMTAAGPVKRERRTTSNRPLNCNEEKSQALTTPSRQLLCEI